MVFAISFREQASDLVEGQRNQRLAVGGRYGVAFAGGDDGEDGMGEHHQGGVPIPGVPLADLGLVQADGLPIWKQVSTCHLVPATVTNTCSGTGRGDQQR